MGRSYGTVSSAFWLDDKVLALSTHGKLLALYLLTGPHSNSIGCFRLPDAYISADLKWDEETVTQTVSELLANGFIDRCSTTGWTLIPKYLKHNPPANPNVVKGMVKLADLIPSSVPFNQALSDAFAPFDETLSKRFAERSRNSLETRNPNRNPIPNRNQEPSEAKASGADGAASPALPEVNPKRAVFEQGLAYLTASGVADKHARSLLGRWCRDVGDGAAIDILTRASANAVADPVPWIEAAIKRHRSPENRPRDGPPKQRFQSAI